MIDVTIQFVIKPTQLTKCKVYLYADDRFIYVSNIRKNVVKKTFPRPLKSKSILPGLPTSMWWGDSTNRNSLKSRANSYMMMLPSGLI